MATRRRRGGKGEKPAGTVEGVGVVLGSGAIGWRWT
jgi:hypothetical protein